jgi:nicotinamidase-related amidase
MSQFTDRTKTALLVIDVQVGVVQDAFQRDLKINNIESAVRKARANSVPIVWIQHSDESLLIESESWQIVPELKPLVDEVMVRKTFRSSFEGTNLEEILVDLNVRHLYICGAETNNCIRHTCHAAFEKGYDVTLLSDAHTTTGFEWNGYIVDAARVIDEQNTNFSGYSLPGRVVNVTPVAQFFE